MSLVTVTVKVHVSVTETEKALLDSTMSAYRDACNYTSDFVFSTRCLNSAFLNNSLYHTLRERFGLKSQMAQSVLKTVVAKYKSILESEGEWVKPVFSKPQLDLVWNRDYSLKQEVFSVNTLGGRMKLPYFSKGMERYFDRSVYHFGTARLVKKQDKYFLHIPVTFEVGECRDTDICNIVGIDRGINFVVATYDSSHKSSFVSGRQVKSKRANYKRLRKELQQIGTPSSRRRLKTIGQRENRWMQDMNHCISKALVESNPSGTLFVLEDLTGVRNATERVRVKDRYVNVSWAFYDLEEKLKYKAQIKGSKVINVSPRYTSQQCPVCGHTEKANRNKRMHTFCCRMCGYRSNDDRVGAMNLYRKGVDYLADSQRLGAVV